MGEKSEMAIDTRIPHVSNNVNKPLTWLAKTLPLRFNLNSNNETRYRLGKNVGKYKDIAAK